MTVTDTTTAAQDLLDRAQAGRPSEALPNTGDLDVTVSPAELLAALDFTKRDQNTRPPMQILLGVLLQASDDGLQVSRFDYEQSNTEVITGVGTGRAIVGAATLRDVVTGLDAEPLTLAVRDGRLHVQQGELAYALPAFDLDEVPALPEPGEQVAVVMTGAQLYSLLPTLVAAGRDTTLPVLTGAFWEFGGDVLTVAATDRYRLAVTELALATSTLPSLLVPAKPLHNIAVALKTAPEVELRVWFAAPEPGRKAEPAIDMVSFVAGSRTITLRTVDGEFPRFRALLPTEFSGRLTTQGKALTRAVSQVSKVCEHHAPVRFELGAGDSALCGGSAGLATARKALSDVEFAGLPLTIAANPAFLLDGIKACGGGDLALAFTGPTRPFVLSDPSRPEFRYLLMPVRSS